MSPSLSAPTATPPPTESPEASAESLTDAEKSDAFWLSAVGGHNDYYYETAASLVDDAHLIVVGVVSGVREGETYTEEMPEGFPTPTLRFFYATVDIEQVLKGEPQTLSPGTIDLRMVGDYRHKTDIVPSESTLFFLLNGGELAADRGQPQEEQELWRNAYVPLGLSGIARNIDGVSRSHLLLADCCPDSYPATADGDPFESVVERAAEVAAGPLGCGPVIAEIALHGRLAREPDRGLDCTS